MRITSKSSEAPGSGRDRVLFLLKRDGPQATARVAQQLGVTAMAVRQHLSVLHAEGLVEFSDEQRKIGRPARIWRLTPKADARFPDHHAGLAVDMLRVVQSTFGAEGLERLTDGWTRKQVAAYRAQMPRQDLPLDQRVAALVRIRCEEGFMSECRPAQDGTIELVERALPPSDFPYGLSQRSHRDPTPIAPTCTRCTAAVPNNHAQSQSPRGSITARSASHDPALTPAR